MSQSSSGDYGIEKGVFMTQMNIMDIASPNKELPALRHQESLLIAKTLLTHEQVGEQSDIKEITKSHWVPVEKRHHCSRKQCRKKFTFFEKPHHCRRCGEVFCYECTKYSRKLNKLANPDPDGKQYKVCKACCIEDPQDIGQTRNIFEEFQEARGLGKAVRNARLLGQQRAGWRNRLDLEKECNRLLEGFKAELQRSEILKAMIELKKMVTIPDWQKGMNWIQESLCTTCQTCGCMFNRLLNKKHHCRVCALAVCGNCSSQKLILYVEDKEMGSFLNEYLWKRLSFTESVSQSVDLDPKLAIIEIIGCPDKEPNICLYLRICTSCLTMLTEIQVKQQRESVSSLEEDILTKMADIWEEFSETKNKIEEFLEKYCSTIDSLENNSAGNPNKGMQSQSNMKVLAKAQTDLSDFFTSYILKVQELKQFRRLPATPAQAKLLQNFVKAHCEYYLENMFIFRNMKNKLASISPPETLQLIQEIVDKNTIISSHLYIKQLLFEVLHLVEKHKVLETLPVTLLQLEQVLEKEAECCLKRHGEDWEEHITLSQQILQSQIKNHKLVRPSRRFSKKYGSAHIHDITKQRSLEVVRKIRLQLQLKAAHNSFKRSQDNLQQCQNEIEQL